MKLVVDILDFEHGKAYGYESYLLNLISDFAKFRDEFIFDEIIIACNVNQDSYIRNVSGDLLSIKTFNSNGYLNRLNKQRKLPKLLNLNSNDVVLYTGNYQPLFGKRTKTIVVIHDLLFKHSQYLKNSIYFFFFKWFRDLYIPRSLKKSDAIIAISDFTKKEIIKFYGINPEKISTIYNYFDFGKYCEFKDIPIVAGKYLISVCASALHKNHRVLIEGFSLVLDKYKDLKFVIVGGINEIHNEYFENLPDTIKERIIFFKRISDSEMRNLYQYAKAYVSASMYEGLGMPIVEALYFGLPLILSDIDIHHEVSFDYAQFFNPTSPIELANCIESLDSCDDIKDRPYIIEKVLDRYCRSNTSLKYLELLNRFAKI